MTTASPERAATTRAPATAALLRIPKPLWAVAGLCAAAELMLSAAMPVLREQAPQLALMLRPGDAAAALNLAQARMAQGRPAKAASLATLALRSEPLDVEAMRTLGLALDRQGRGGEAQRLLAFAGRRSWRDGPTHLWLLKQRVVSGELEAGFKDADSLMRRTPETSRALFRVFVAAAADPKAIAPLAERLAARPPWRKDFLKDLASSPEGVDRAGPIYAALARTSAPGTAAELGDYFRAMVKAGRYAEAERQWRLLSPRTYAARRSGLSNGDFSGAPAPEPFGWRLGDGQGGSAAIEAADEPARGLALHVIYDGYSTADLASQVLLLAPGAYRLTMRTRVVALDSRTPLSWSLACLDGGRAALDPASASAQDASGWRVLGADVVVPASGCTAQRLVLEGRSEDHRGPSEAWYDDLAIRPR